MCVSRGRRGMGQRGSKRRDHEAACATVSDDSREAGAAGGWLDCHCNKTLLQCVVRVYNRLYPAVRENGVVPFAATWTGPREHHAE